MAISISELEAADPAALLAAGERATAAAATAAQQVSTANQTVTTMQSSWQGDASTAATNKAGDYIKQHQSFQQSLQDTGSLLTAGGNGLTQSRTSILSYVDQLKTQGWQVADDGSVSVRSGSALDTYSKLSPVGAVTLKLLATKASSELKTNLAKFTEADQELAEKLKKFWSEEESPDDSGKPTPDEKNPDEPKPDESDDEKIEMIEKKGLTDEEKAEMEHWSQFFVTDGSDNGGGDCSRWATASALASKYGTRIGADGQKEIDLPENVQQNLMNGAPLHFPPTKSEINQIAQRQGVAAGSETEGFPGGPDLMSQQLTEIGVPSESHTGDPSALVDQMTTDLNNGHSAIVNGAFPGSQGHFISVTGTTTGPNGETLYVVNDSNRVSDGSSNNHTVPSPCTRSQLEQFLRDRAQYGPPGYSTV